MSLPVALSKLFLLSAPICSSMEWRGQDCHNRADVGLCELTIMGVLTTCWLSLTGHMAQPRRGGVSLFPVTFIIFPSERQDKPSEEL